MSPASSPRAPLTGALGAALALTGLGFDVPSVLIPGVTLLLLAAIAFAWVELASRRARLEREPGPRRVVEGRAYPLRIRLRGTLLPPPGGRLEDSLLERPAPVGPRWPRRYRRDLALRGPGRRRLEPSRLIVSDPLGLWSREVRSAAPHDLVVLPRIDPVVLGAAAGDALGEAGSDGSSQTDSGGLVELEVDGLRPYRDGSPASRIHWPAVARSGEMIERRLTSGGGSRPLVVLDARGPARDMAIRAAASLCVALARAGGCGLLLPGERRPLEVDPQLRAWPEAHVRIALAGSGAPRLGTAMRGRAVFWVTASSSRPPGLARLGPGSYLVGAKRQSARAAFTVGRCQGIPLGAVPRRRRAVAAGTGGRGGDAGGSAAVAQ